MTQTIPIHRANQRTGRWVLPVAILIWLLCAMALLLGALPCWRGADLALTLGTVRPHRKSIRESS